MFVEFVRVQGHCVFSLIHLAMISPPLARAARLLMPEGEGQEISRRHSPTPTTPMTRRAGYENTSYRKFEAQSYVEYARLTG